MRKKLPVMMSKDNTALPRRMRRKFWRNQEGATAIEFAIIAAPFLYLILGGIEVGLINLTYSSVQHGMQEALRGVQTGSLECVTTKQIKETICERVKTASAAECIRNSRLSLRELPSYKGGGNFNKPFTELEEQASRGNGDAIMLMQVVYRWDTLTPLLDRASGGGNGETYLRNTVVFKNEPFGNNDDESCEDDDDD